MHEASSIPCFIRSRGEKPIEFERALCVVVTTWLPALRVAVVAVLTTWATFNGPSWSTLWCALVYQDGQEKSCPSVHPQGPGTLTRRQQPGHPIFSDTSLCNAGNMKQTVLLVAELNKGVEWLKTNNATSVLLVTSGTLTIALMRSAAASAAPLVPAIKTVPSS